MRCAPWVACQKFAATGLDYCKAYDSALSD
jgi:hypothetical protein